MRASTILLLAIAAVSTTGCATSSDDYLVKGKERQEIALGGAKAVIVRCYCPTTSIKTSAKSRNVVLNVAGNYGSSGYHGQQDKPKSMPKSFLAFLAKNDGMQLTLESREFTYMHHFHLLSTVTVIVPPDVAVRFETIPLKDLYDRKVE